MSTGRERGGAGQVTGVERSDDAPRVAGVLETCLYASDLEAAERFYTEIIGLDRFAGVAGRHVFFRASAASVLLVFDPARTVDPEHQSAVNGVPVPTHGAEGAGHVAFAIRDDAVDAWRARFEAAGVAVEAEISWPRGGRSLYVRDPAGNSVELASPRIWGLPEPDAA